MEKSELQKIIKDTFVSEGFHKKGSYYYKVFEDLITVVGMQKSNFEKRYYLNLGFVIKSLNPNASYPRDIDGDVRARFGFKEDNKVVDFLDIQNLTENEIEKIREELLKNIDELIKPVTSIQDLKDLLTTRPVMLYQTKLTAKQLLGFE